MGIEQTAVAFSRLPSADAVLFWEMVELVFQNVALRTGPIETMEDPVDVLSTRRVLYVQERMYWVMNSRGDFFLLNQKMWDAK